MKTPEITSQIEQLQLQRPPKMSNIILPQIPSVISNFMGVSINITFCVCVCAATTIVAQFQVFFITSKIGNVDNVEVTSPFDANQIPS